MRPGHNPSWLLLTRGDSKIFVLRRILIEER